jgi:DNA polymerase-3 subunit chi
MTEITFHFNVAERMPYACRLLRKAARQGANVAVTGAGDTLSRLDRELWSFDPVSFVPHVRLRTGAPVPDRLRPTKVWLVEDALAAPHHDVLVNLGAGSPVGFESYSKLIEIVTAAEADRAAARVRWKHYANRGYPIESRGLPQ